MLHRLEAPEGALQVQNGEGVGACGVVAEPRQGDVGRLELSFCGGLTQILRVFDRVGTWIA